jgi:hypothetical protein
LKLPFFCYSSTALAGGYSCVTLTLTLTPFFEDFSATQPFLLQQVNNQLVHDFLSQQNNILFFFFLSLWIYLWLAETSQQPISQTTWLKVTFHCNHCNHWHSGLPRFK